MVQFLSIIFFSWSYSIFVGFFKSSRFFCVTLQQNNFFCLMMPLSNFSSLESLYLILCMYAFLRACSLFMQTDSLKSDRRITRHCFCPEYMTLLVTSRYTFFCQFSMKCRQMYGSAVGKKAHRYVRGSLPIPWTISKILFNKYCYTFVRNVQTWPFLLGISGSLDFLSPSSILNEAVFRK